MRLRPADRSGKEILDQLHVHAWTPQGFLHAGVLQMSEDGDRDISAVFEYAPDYLAQARDGAYPLDPINMPLARTNYATHQHHVVLGAIFDAAPDAWGRRVIKASVSLDDQSKVYRNAFLRGADGIGALVLTPDKDTPLDEIVAASLSERPGLSRLEDAARAARQLETHGEVDDSLVALLAGSWTIGGARPKAILRDDGPNAVPGRSLIAKFPGLAAPEGSALEWACLAMAREMGLTVPDHALRDVAGERVLLLERFDRGPRAQRRHYVSAMSFVSAMPGSKFLDTEFDRATFSWENLLHMTSRVAARPSEARVQMFARLALNAALGNTDDHLKNYGFLRCDDDAFHYEVAPVFDITPQPSRSHYLNCGHFGRQYTLQDVMSDPRALGISAAAARDVEERIRSVLARREAFFHQAGMSDGARRAANAVISRSLGDAEGSDDESSSADSGEPLRQRFRS